MKRILFLTVFSVITIAAMAGSRVIKNDDGSKISYSVKRQFEQEFKNAEEITWTYNNGYQKAFFRIKGQKMTAIYDQQGNFLGATKYIAVHEMPERAKNKLEKKYKGYQISEVLEVVKRPVSDDYSNGDVGTIWVSLSNENKEIILRSLKWDDFVVEKVVNANQVASTQ